MTGWVPDVLPGFEAATALLPDAAEGRVPVTLVRAVGASQRPPGRPAVLHLHGYNDYFFQRHLAEAWLDRGAEFFALDLRRCGRSWRPWQTPHLCTSLRDYWPVTSAAVAAIAALGHPRPVILAHSTGGLVAALWAHAARRRDAVRALVLDGPFLEVPGSRGSRALSGIVAERLGAVAPDLVLRDDGSPYAGRLHVSGGGEWDFDTALKRPSGVPVRAGWLRAVRRGQARVAAGLDIRVPVLVACAAASGPEDPGAPDLERKDTVIDTDRVAALAPGLGPDVTVVRIPDAVHDLSLSAPAARAAYLAAVSDWLEDLATTGTDHP